MVMLARISPAGPPSSAATRVEKSHPVEPTPDGETPEASGRPDAAAPPPGTGAFGDPGGAPSAPPGAAQPGAPSAWPPPPWAQPGPTAAFGRVDRTPVVWTAVGAAALISVATFTVCALLAVMAPPAEQQRDAPAAADPARHTSKEFAARPAPVEVDIDDHPAYELAMPAQVTCDVPDLDPESSSSWEAFSTRLSDCLGRLWQPRLKHLGLRTAEPEFRISRTDPDSGSGAQGMTLAYYEHDPMSITVVMPNVSEFARDAPDGSQEAVWSALLAHEYGHHIQELTGILDVSTALEREAPSEDARMEQLR